MATAAAIRLELFDQAKTLKLLLILSVLSFGRGPRRPFRRVGKRATIRTRPNQQRPTWQRRSGDVRRSQIERRITAPALRKARRLVASPQRLTQSIPCTARQAIRSGPIARRGQAALLVEFGTGAGCPPRLLS
jgi:hypothetical protein